NACLSAIETELSMTNRRSISSIAVLMICSTKTLLVVGVCSTTGRSRQPAVKAAPAASSAPAKTETGRRRIDGLREGVSVMGVALDRGLGFREGFQARMTRKGGASCSLGP